VVFGWMSMGSPDGLRSFDPVGIADFDHISDYGFVGHAQLFLSGHSDLSRCVASGERYWSGSREH